MWRRRLVLCAGMLGLLPGKGQAQAMDLPVEAQIPIFLKLLTFDRNLPTEAGAELVVAIVFQGGNRASVELRRQVDAELRKAVQLFEGLTARVVAIDLDVENHLAQRLVADSVDAIYVGPLRAFDLKSILLVSRSRHIRTFSGVSRYVSQGVAMGATMRGDLPQILVNLPAARAEGADYPAQVLKLARVLE